MNSYMNEILLIVSWHIVDANKTFNGRKGQLKLMAFLDESRESRGFRGHQIQEAYTFSSMVMNGTWRKLWEEEDLAKDLI